MRLILFLLRPVTPEAAADTFLGRCPIRDSCVRERSHIRFAGQITSREESPEPRALRPCRNRLWLENICAAVGGQVAGSLLGGYRGGGAESAEELGTGDTLRAVVGLRPTW